jgi:tRNA-Thr(GGU) m(6)t(6)A37 methyltransferase TsaA
MIEITFHPIGVIHSPFQDLAEMPIQPGGGTSAPGTVEVYPEYVPGLKDLEGFSHIILLYYLHKVNRVQLSVVPFLDTEPRGVFATRAPVRPNPIGLSVVPLMKIEGHILSVDQLDILDGTPLLDIKPYVPGFDHQPDVRIGWLEHARGTVESTRSDDRFKSS